MKERTVTKLSEMKGRIYVYLADETIGKEFFNQAANEGFTFADGEIPTKRHYSMVMAVNHDKTINYVGTNGMIAFQCNAPIGDEQMIRIDYARYINGEEDFIYQV